MACFLAPAAEAIIVTVIRKNEQKREAAALRSGAPAHVAAASESGIPWSRKLGWLTRMLWGGVFLLAIEHIWHGEVVFMAPVPDRDEQPRRHPADADGDTYGRRLDGIIRDRGLVRYDSCGGTHMQKVVRAGDRGCGKIGGIEVCVCS